MRAEGIADIRFVTPDDYIDEVRARGAPLPHCASTRRHGRRRSGSCCAATGTIRRGTPARSAASTTTAKSFAAGRSSSGSRAASSPTPSRRCSRRFGSRARDPARRRGARSERVDDLTALDDGARVAVHMRAMQRACNFGWQPDEARHKWPYMHGLGIAEILRASSATPPSRMRVGRIAALAAAAGARAAAASIACSRSSSIRASRRALRHRRSSASAPVTTQRAPMRSSISQNAEARRRRASALVRRSTPRTRSSSPAARSMRARHRAHARAPPGALQGGVSRRSTRSSERGCPIDDTAGDGRRDVRLPVRRLSAALPADPARPARRTRSWRSSTIPCSPDPHPHSRHAAIMRYCPHGFEPLRHGPARRPRSAQAGCPAAATSARTTRSSASKRAASAAATTSSTTARFERSYPVIPGHEPVGIIDEIGDDAATRWGVAAGDRVAVEAADPLRPLPRLHRRARSRLCRGGDGIPSYGFRPTRRWRPALWGGYADAPLPPAARRRARMSTDVARRDRRRCSTRSARASAGPSRCRASARRDHRHPRPRPARPRHASSPRGRPARAASSSPASPRDDRQARRSRATFGAITRSTSSGGPPCAGVREVTDGADGRRRHRRHRVRHRSRHPGDRPRAPRRSHRPRRHQGPAARCRTSSATESSRRS